MNGYTLIGSFDVNDPSCVRDYGPHTVVTRAVRATFGRDCVDFEVESGMYALEYYLNAFNTVCARAVSYHPYNIQAYEQGDGSIHLYISVYF